MGKFTVQFIANLMSRDTLEWYWLPIIITIEALAMLPMCRVLNF